MIIRVNVFRVITDYISDAHLAEIRDFFELIKYAQKKKVQLLIENPYIMQFAVRSFYSKNEVISEELQENTAKIIEGNFKAYFKNLEWYKFKDGIDPKQIYNMIIWMVDGYMHNLEMEGKPIDIDDVDKTVSGWTALFKQIAYKEEYQ